MAPIRGVVAIEITSGVPEECIAASAKPMGPGQLRDFGSHVRSVHQQMTRTLITPCWARYYDFGAGRVPAFLARRSTP